MESKSGTIKTWKIWTIRVIIVEIANANEGIHMNDYDKSYERYKNWQINKNRYKHESIGLILFFAIGFYVGSKIGGFIGGIIVFFALALLYFVRLNKTTKQLAPKAEVQEQEASKQKNIVTVTTDIKKTASPSIVENGDGTETMSEENKKTTETGYINKNNQRNVGKTDLRGTDHGQYLYAMECLNCGHKYFANGSDIWLRKCPECQNGAK